jgi:hypothetical protein
MHVPAGQSLILAAPKLPAPVPRFIASGAPQGPVTILQSPPDSTKVVLADYYRQEGSMPISLGAPSASPGVLKSLQSYARAQRGLEEDSAPPLLDVFA